MTPERRLTLLRITAIVIVITISIFIYLIRDSAEQLAQYGYVGIFILSILANATLILPAPGIAIVFAMGSVFNPIGIALSAGLGSAIGELTGYMAGFSGQAVVENKPTYERIYSWLKAHRSGSFLIIFLLAVIPNPIFDIAGIAAGTLRIPVWEFLLWTFLGKTVKMFLIAYAGSITLKLFG
jgi:uncharacterized membrane protein YdjX (TVP38/TMEM64 family)